MTHIEMTASVAEQKVYGVMNFVAKAVRRPLLMLTDYYSSVTERQVSPRQTLVLLNAQVAALLTIFPTEAPCLLRAACCAWLVKALLRCKAEL